jgi:excisionase family DNA binding protein
MERLFSVQDTAEILGGISKWTIYAWIKQGRLRRVKLGSRTMVTQSEINRIIAEGSEDQNQGGEE